MRALLRQRLYSEVAPIAARVLAYEPRCAAVLFLQAEAELQAGSTSKALVHYGTARAAEPNNREYAEGAERAAQLDSLMKDGARHLNDKKYAEAAEIYTRALEVDPHLLIQRATLLCKRASALQEVGRREEALADLDESLVLKPNSAATFAQRAILHRLRGDLRACEADFDRVHRLIPDEEHYETELRRAKAAVRRTTGFQGRCDHYAVLGVDSMASERDLRKAYFKIAIQNHPQKQPADASPEQKASAERRFREVGEAYAVLSDSVKRNFYDEAPLEEEEEDDESMFAAPPGFDPLEFFQKMLAARYAFGPRRERRAYAKKVRNGELDEEEDEELLRAAQMSDDEANED
jgi:DnaJ homolog subfamily C member 7